MTWANMLKKIKTQTKLKLKLHMVKVFPGVTTPGNGRTYFFVIVVIMFFLTFSSSQKPLLLFLNDLYSS